MSRYSVPIVLFSLFFTVSCSNFGRSRELPPPKINFDLPPEQKAPVLRILDYENMAANASLRPWLRGYLENNVSGLESQDLYRDSYLFISSVRSPQKAVVDRWLVNYKPERDFPRLAADRIQKRLHRDLAGVPPDTLYGPNYEKTIREAYHYSFWGAERLDDTWIYALSTAEDEAQGDPLFWGFILLRVPRETLEIQVLALLSEIGENSTGGGRPATREQNNAFDDVKQIFLDQF